jgi:hypothetical protein
MMVKSDTEVTWTNVYNGRTKSFARFRFISNSLEFEGITDFPRLGLNFLRTVLVGLRFARNPMQLSEA